MLLSVPTRLAKRQLKAQTKCIYTNAHSMVKQEELVATAQMENYDITVMTETWWDESHKSGSAINAYKLFRRDRKEGKGG